LVFGLKPIILRKVSQLQGDPGAVKINFDEHKGFTWVRPADALKMDLLQDEDACIMKDYFSNSPYAK
jgi:hypothetical protein